MATPLYLQRWMDGHLHCSNERPLRNEEYDCYYCVGCGEWLETKCSDINCEFCSKRPEKAPNVNKTVKTL